MKWFYYGHEFPGEGRQQRLKLKAGRGARGEREVWWDFLAWDRQWPELGVPDLTDRDRWGGGRTSHVSLPPGFCYYS